MYPWTIGSGRVLFQRVTNTNDHLFRQYMLHLTNPEIFPFFLPFLASFVPVCPVGCCPTGDVSSPLVHYQQCYSGLSALVALVISVLLLPQPTV